MQDSKIKAYNIVEDNVKDIELYHEIMQLGETLLNATTQLRIHDHMDEPCSKLAKMTFHRLLIEDGMTNAIRNPEMWLRDVTTKLNQFVDLL